LKHDEWTIVERAANVDRCGESQIGVGHFPSPASTREPIAHSIDTRKHKK
jgi:hypothetical protein